MAQRRRRLEGNAPGPFFVDSSCIDCDQCRQIAPAVFREDGGVSVVFHQPADAEQALRAEMALVTCPTASIGAEDRCDLSAAIAAFPEPIEGEVYFLGFAAESSYGASSYLIRRAGGGVIVDSPRWTRPLARRIAELGGAATLVLTHQDDVADQHKIRRDLGAARVMHRADAAFTVERPIDGELPVQLSPDLTVIPTPGHTRGHIALLYRDRFLFTGDHLWGDGEGGLGASRSVCWYSWPEQRRSMRRLLDFDFEWVLPGHGPRLNLPRARMKQQLERLIARM